MMTYFGPSVCYSVSYNSRMKLQNTDFWYTHCLQQVLEQVNVMWYGHPVWVRHSEGPPFRRSGTIVQSAFTGIKTDSANKRYLFNAIPDTNHNANPTNPNRYSKGNFSEWRTFGMADRYQSKKHVCIFCLQMVSKEVSQFVPSARKTLSLCAAAVSNRIYACKDVSWVTAWIVRVIVRSLAIGLADCSQFVAPQRQTSDHRTVCWFAELDTCRCPTNATSWQSSAR